MGRPYVGTTMYGRGIASPSPGDAPRRPQFPRPASRFVCSGHERERRHERPRATQWVAPTLGHNVRARHCLALTRRRPAPPHNFPGMPRDLFVPGTNERVGMNDRGRPSGSPLRWDTMWARGMPRPYPAAPRVAPQFPRPASRFVCSGHERARRHERPRATQWVAPTLGHKRRARGTASPSSGDAPRRPQFPRRRLAICLFRARTSASA